MHVQPILYFSAADNEMTAYHQDLLLTLDESAGKIRGETGIEGIYLDFNYGLRLSVPVGDYVVHISDSESGQIYFSAAVSGKTLISMEKYYIHWQIDLFKQGKHIFSHTMDVTAQTVYMQLGNALGDMLAVMPYVLAFQQRYHCRIVCSQQDNFSSLFAACWPTLTMVPYLPEDCYAAFVLGIFQGVPILSPVDARCVPLPYMGRILLDIRQTLPLVRLEVPSERQIGMPYVCIATQASGVNKCWLRPGGWDTVTAWLNQAGYRVLCIDGDAKLEQAGYVVGIPHGAEDCTGRQALTERAALLAHAVCFIGVSSGLSWLAAATGTPVVLISGFTLPSNEFDTPYRVINYQVCHGCHNDIRVDDKKMFCPYHQGTVREMECSRQITAEQVMGQVERCLSEHVR